MSDGTVRTQWPDPLSAPTPDQVQRLLMAFWEDLRILANLLPSQEQLLTAEVVSALRRTMIDMMLALNGIQRPLGTHHLNHYLSTHQRFALERTLLAPDTGNDRWIGQAVALVVIYRWYAPQLVRRFDLAYPQALESSVWQHLQQTIPEWPKEITTD